MIFLTSAKHILRFNPIRELSVEISIEVISIGGKTYRRSSKVVGKMSVGCPMVPQVWSDGTRQDDSAFSGRICAID